MKINKKNTTDQVRNTSSDKENISLLLVNKYKKFKIVPYQDNLVLNLCIISMVGISKLFYIHLSKNNKNSSDHCTGKCFRYEIYYIFDLKISFRIV